MTGGQHISRGDNTIKGHPAFTHERSHEIETLGLVVHEFRHQVTGAAHYHLETSHDENVFMVAFRTVPMDSTGVAHILEHTVLCGSERFPVRDPFFWMIRRSLNTFMNAFTTSDYTAFPFASQNRKDYFNLLDVYLDAVFFSRLDPLDFAQEGCRVEFKDPEDPSTPLVFRGVVYNEMKGDSSSAISVLFEEIKKHLYPTTTYHYNSGGDPRHIPDLTYEGLRDFYKSHYHPGNAIFMTFGNIPVAELQAEMQDKALYRFGAAPARIGVKSEQRLAAPVSVSAPYGVDGTDGKTHILVGWLLAENTDLQMLLKCNLLSDALLDTSASPLRHALETSSLAGAVSPLSGLEETSHEMSFLVGVEGSEPQHGEAVESLILSTLQRVAEEGIPMDRLEACLHQLELSQREIGGDGTPFGLQMIFSCMSAAIHRGDPIGLLDLDPVLTSLREQIKDPDFIKSLVRDLLLANPHRVTLVLYPDLELNRRQEQEEALRLERMRASLDAASTQLIVERAKALAQRQAQEEDVSVLPRVGIEDVAEDLSIPHGRRVTTPAGLNVTCFGTGTNGLVYHQVTSRLPPLSLREFLLLPYYTSLVSEVGSGGEGYLLTQHQQHSQTGGISAYATFRAAVDDLGSTLSHLTLSSRTLNAKAELMMALLKRTHQQPNFSESSRMRELIKQMRVRREGSITGNGHGLAMSAAASNFSQVSLVNHELSGLAGIERLKKLDDGLADDGSLVQMIEVLGSLHDRLLKARPEFLLIGEDAVLPQTLVQLDSLWSGQASVSELSGLTFKLPDPALAQAWVTTTQVNFCAAAFGTVPECHRDSAPLSVLAGVLRNGYLHRVLREQGGAYGGGASHDATNGVFRFYSYRDPNLLRTLDEFRASVDWVINSNIAFDLVEESILGLISSIDAPGSPAGIARQSFHNELFGRTAEHRRRVRRAILDVGVDDIKRVATTWLCGQGAEAVVTDDAGARQLANNFIIRTV